jgi:deferrochelatase/peroxidase EfeB
MNQSFITVVAPLRVGDVARAEAAIDRLGNPVGAPARAALDQLDADGAGIHFASLHAIASQTPGKAYLLLEISADGTVEQGLGRLVKAIGLELTTIFALASDWQGTDLAAYLGAHALKTGYGWGDWPGLDHSGTPGFSVGRIREEARIVECVARAAAEPAADGTALERVELLRRRLAESGIALDLPPAPDIFIAGGLAKAASAGLFAVFRTYLWPLGLPALLWAVYTGWHQGVAAGLLTLVLGLGAALIVALALGLLAYIRLRVLENRDWVSERTADPTVMRRMLERENYGVQNHMISITTVKPGLLRKFTLRLAFCLVAALNPVLFRPGYLGPIGTIHFARWVRVPGTRDLVFASNYGGSWEAYLEDFITLAHLGLTAVWSNTVGFPRAESLVLKGATDGERFKRFARQSMVPTRFWYSAYPDLITDMIRTHADIRRGLSSAMTEDDARNLLARFGSALRPDASLQTNDIQSLVFGGMGFLKAMRLTTWQLGDDPGQSRAWLQEIMDFVAFGDGRKIGAAPGLFGGIQIAFSAAGLRRFGLSEQALRTFPIAFVDGMAGPHRSRILGDVGADGPENWWWREAGDVAILIYGQDDRTVARLQSRLTKTANKCGVSEGHRVDARSFDRANNYEPFGFADGGSQPVIRGTYKGTVHGDPMHLVEPGEFVLGYPDNRGNRPPTPELDAADDPFNLLPGITDSPSFGSATADTTRDLGRNGTFLVIRQLEQHGAAFNGYCEEQANKLKLRIGSPYVVNADFVAAKLMGRWRNGAPLVRAPYSASSSESIIKENSFRLGEEDPEGFRCPFGAHIRRANPRDSLNPGSQDQIAISNRHRIMRVGRKYEPEQGQEPGLLFVAINADLERQFEFIQQTWLRGPIISLSCPSTFLQEGDPLLGAASGAPPAFTIPTVSGPIRLDPAPKFVTMRGGGYYFMPGRQALWWLARGSG